MLASPQDSSTPTHDSPPSREALLDLIRDEIASASAVQQQPGWTPWALAGALAAVGWLLVSEISTGLQAIHVAIVALGATMAVEAVLMLRSSVDTAETLPRATQRFILTSAHYGASRLEIIWLMVRAVAIVCVTLALRTQLASFWHSWPTVIVFSIAAIGGVVELIRSLMDIPMAMPTRKYHWVGLLFLMPLAATAWRCGAWFYSHYSEFSINSTRTGLLIVALTMILTYMAKGVARSPLANTLLDIRRELTLGRLSVSEAASRLDMTIAGMKVNHVLQDAVHTVLDAERRVVGKLSQVNAEIDAVKSLAKDNANGHAMRALNVSIAAHLRETRHAAARLEEAVKMFGKRSRRLIGKANDGDLIAVMSKVDAAEDRVHQALTLVEQAVFPAPQKENAQLPEPQPTSSKPVE